MTALMFLVGFYTGVMTLYFVQLLHTKKTAAKKKRTTRKLVPVPTNLYLLSRELKERHEELENDPSLH